MWMSCAPKQLHCSVRTVLKQWRAWSTRCCRYSIPKTTHSHLHCNRCNECSCISHPSITAVSGLLLYLPFLDCYRSEMVSLCGSAIQSRIVQHCTDLTEIMHKADRSNYTALLLFRLLNYHFNIVAVYITT